MPHQPFFARLNLTLAAVVLAVSLGLPVCAYAVVLARFEENGLRVTLSDDSTSGGALYHLDVEDVQGVSEFDLSADVFVLDNPVRLVVDVPGFAAKRSVNKILPHADLGAVRVGRHPDKARIVIDFKGAELPNHHLRLAPGGRKMTVEIGYFGEPVKARNSEDLTETRPTPVTPTTIPDNAYAPPEPEEPVSSGQPGWEEFEPATPTTTLSTTLLTTTTTTSTTLRTTTSSTAKTTLSRTTTTAAPAVPGEEPLDLPISKQQLNEMIEEDARKAAPPEAQDYGSQYTGPEAPPSDPIPPIEEPPMPRAPQVTSGGGASVTGIFFKADNGLGAAESTAKEGSKATPAVMISVEPLGNYSLSQEKPNVYQLIIEHAHLSGEHLTLPQFPPDALSGFEVVSATQEDGNVVVKIYVEDNIKLSPFRVDNQVWLSASQ